MSTGDDYNRGLGELLLDGLREAILYVKGNREVITKSIPTVKPIDTTRKYRQCLIDTRHFEGLRLSVYTDSKGIPTIGYGHNLTTGNSLLHCSRLGLNHQALVDGTASITKDQAEALFQLDMAVAHSDAVSLVPDLDSMPFIIQEVMNDLSFNIGKTRLSKFHRTLAALEKRDYTGFRDGLEDSKWDEDVGNRAIAIINALNNNLNLSE